MPCHVSTVNNVNVPIFHIIWRRPCCLMKVTAGNIPLRISPTLLLLASHQWLACHQVVSSAARLRPRHSTARWRREADPTRVTRQTPMESRCRPSRQLHLQPNVKSRPSGHYWKPHSEREMSGKLDNLWSGSDRQRKENARRLAV